MKQVELIRARIVRGVSMELIRVRGFLSSIEGNGTEVDLLIGPGLAEATAKATECIMGHLGHSTEVKTGGGGNPGRRVRR